MEWLVHAGDLRRHLTYHDVTNVLFLGNGIGDDCEEDSDGDSTPDDVDTCPYNPNINITSFADYFTIELDPTLTSNAANWEVKDDGKEILQLAVTDMPLLFIGKLLLIGYLFWVGLKVRRCQFSRYLRRICLIYADIVVIDVMPA